MSSSPQASCQPAPASTSHSSKQPEEDSPSKPTSSAVLFRGPSLDLFPSVAQHIASQLALSPPSPLKVLEDTSFVTHKRYPDYYGSVPQSYQPEIKYSAGQTRRGHQRNVYTITVNSSAKSRKLDSSHRYWHTIEIPSISCSLAPAQTTSLFDGMIFYLQDDVGKYKTELQDLVELFGGQVVHELGVAPDASITHYVAPQPSYETTKIYLEGHRSLAADAVAVHPSWITSSAECGFLLPTSLFILDSDSPCFETPLRQFGGSLPAFFSSAISSLATPVQMVFEKPPSLPEPELRACLEGRRLFFDFDASQHLQLVHALSSVVSRMGGEVVSSLALCDWVVTSHRSGAAYLYGLRHPEIIMGTLHYLMANIRANTENPVNPRTNLLYYPLPADHTHTLAENNVQIFISKIYPSEYRQYLSSLFFIMTGRFPLSSGSQIYNDGILIAPCRTLFDDDKIRPLLDLSKRILLPEFLEDSFLYYDIKNIYKLTTKSFRSPKHEFFAPKKLPKDFASLVFSPARISFNYSDHLSELETRWELHEKCEEKKKDCKCSSCADLW